eukprot:3061606-Amphidinium_carterae.2
MTQTTALQSQHCEQKRQQSGIKQDMLQWNLGRVGTDKVVSGEVSKIKSMTNSMTWCGTPSSSTRSPCSMDTDAEDCVCELCGTTQEQIIAS